MVIWGVWVWGSASTESSIAFVVFGCLFYGVRYHDGGCFWMFPNSIIIDSALFGYVA